MFRRIALLGALCLLCLLYGCRGVLEFSPDGKHILLTRQSSGMLFLLNTDGTDGQPVSDTNRVGWATWSPSGKYFLASKNGEEIKSNGTTTEYPGGIALYESSTLKKVLDIKNATFGGFSPDEKFLLAAFTEGSNKQALAMYEVGTGRQLLRLEQALDVVWGEDGRSMDAFFFGNNKVTAIRRYSLPDGKILLNAPWPKRLAKLVPLPLPQVPGVKPLLVLFSKQAAHVYLYQMDGLHLHKIFTFHDNDDFFAAAFGPSVQPGMAPPTIKDNKLLWIRTIAPTKLRLCRFDLKTRTLTQQRIPLPAAMVRPDPGYALIGLEPSLSPDSTRLVYQLAFGTLARRGKEPKATYIAFYTARLDGSAFRLLHRGPTLRLRRLPRQKQYAYDQDETRNFVWSSDGKQLALYIAGANWDGLYLFDADGNGKRELTLPKMEASGDKGKETGLPSRLSPESTSALAAAIQNRRSHRKVPRQWRLGASG